MQHATLELFLGLRLALTMVGAIIIGLLIVGLLIALFDPGDKKPVSLSEYAERTYRA